MKDFVRQRSNSLAWGFHVVSFALLAIGLIAVASAGSTLDRPFWASPMWRTPFGRQAAFVLLGVALMLLTARVAARLLARDWACRWLPLLAMTIALALLAAALIPGLSSAHRGSQRWLRLPFGSLDLGIQPSEIAKLALVGFLASWLGASGAAPKSFFRGLAIPGLVLAATVFLVGVEDFGTAALLAAVGGSMLMVAGCRLLQIVPLAGIGIVVLALLLFGKDYRVDRLKAHADMWNDMRGAGYQPVQSLTTIASGGWAGVGLGAGIQKYGYLPESHTDFVFSVICEEAGLLGGGLVLALFCGFVWLGLRTFFAAATPLERLLAFGLTATLGAQAAMNILVVTALTPTKGISLPFISAGGSGILTFCIATGFLIAIALRSGVDEREP